jgi:hypothetical protein
MPYALGKKPYVKDKRDLKLSKYLPEGVLPTPPPQFGFGRLYPDWGLLGNDQYGDCVFAGSDHETMIWNKVRGGVAVKFTAQNALSDYSAVTGFDPNDPATDNGAVVRDVLSYRRATGMVDATGKRHKIGAFVALDAPNWDQLVVSTYIFGCTGIGFNVPQTAMQQFENGQPWDVVPGDPPIIGGHYVPIVGTLDYSRWMACITWGKRQVMTKAFFLKYCDEAWAILSEEMIRSDGEGLHGFNLATFQADLQKVTSVQ